MYSRLNSRLPNGEGGHLESPQDDSEDVFPLDVDISDYYCNSALL